MQITEWLLVEKEQSSEQLTAEQTGFHKSAEHYNGYLVFTLLMLITVGCRLAGHNS